MKKSILLLSVFLFLTGFVMAIDFNKVECSTLLLFENEIIGQEIPDKIPFSNEIINIYIAEENYGYIQIKDKQIVDLDCSENEEATYDFFIKNKEVINDIALSENKTSTFLEKFNDKDIELKGKTFSRKVKAFFVRIGIKWFA
jgi:hypothetical protein